ncbi:MAG: O-antigen ligase family protein, partial [Planctomycetia bacterium]|nr:O-antigen ligase family protein [Planctomycetia bacterium]
MNDRTLAPAWLSRSAFDTLVPGILLLHLTLSPLIFHRASLEVFEYSKVALLLTTALLLTGCILTAGWGRLSAVLGEITRSPLAAGFLLFALSAACSTATSIQPRTSLWGTFESFAGLWTMLAYTVLFLATWLATRTPEAARRLLAGSVAAAAFAAAYAVVQAVGWDPLPWALVSQVGDYDRPFATLGHANFLGAYLVMVVPVVAHFALLAWSRRHWLSLAVLLLVQALCVCAILLAMSRGAWLALICVCGVLAAGWASSSRQRWLGLCCVGLLICAGGLGGLGLMGKSEAGLLSHVQARLQQFAVAGSRGPVWRASLAMFRERPWFGCGLDAFPLAFGKHRPVELWNAEPNLTPVKAHSEFLHVLATQGLLGGLAVIVVLIGLAHAGWRAWRGTDAVDRPLVLAIIAGVVGFFVQVGFSFMVAGCGVLFVTFSAVLAGLASLRGTAMEQGPRPHALSMLVAGALALLAFGYNLEPLPWTG